MSKITPKNLSYDTTLPPFLARLQAENASNDGRHEFHAVRPKKARNAEEEAEDEPVYFDEGTGETLTKSEWEKQDKEEGKDETEVGGGKEGLDGENGKRTEVEKEKVAAIGGSKKRKVGKVVGGDDGDDGDDRVETGIKSKKVQQSEGKKVEKGKGAKKGKKIKLSFGDDE